MSIKSCNSMYRKSTWLLCTLFMVISGLLFGQEPLTPSQKTHKSIGDILVVTLPALSMGSTLIWKDQQKGGLQFTKALGTTLALTYATKVLINKERPNGEDYSFPSGHTSVAFCSAAFIQRRYGWTYGIPAYALASYVGYSRIKANKHDGWDVLAGAISGIGISYLFTKPFKKQQNLDVSFSGGTKHTVLTVTYSF